MDEGCTQISFDTYTMSYCDSSILQNNKGCIKTEDKQMFIKNMKTSNLGMTHKENFPNSNPTIKFTKESWSPKKRNTLKVIETEKVNLNFYLTDTNYI